MYVILFSLFIAFFPSPSTASEEGLTDKLDQYRVSGLSRPCCSFSLDTMGVKLGIAGVIDPSELGEHHFARMNKQKDNVGILYTCKAGFIDVSHLRDNADWSAHIYFKLKSWLGKGLEIEARREGGFKSRSLFFPKMTNDELSTLNEEDLQAIAISAGFSLSLLHEIATSFSIAVSAPASVLAFEKSSAFSIEDAYSNLLGNYLGVKSAVDTLAYNQAMTDHLRFTLESLEAQPKENTTEAYESVRNIWWKKGFSSSFKGVLRRHFAYQDEVKPRLIKDTAFCGDTTAEALKIPGTLSNGRSVHDYYEVRSVLNVQMKMALKRRGLYSSPIITQKDYPAIIEAIRQEFIAKLGARIEDQ